MILIYLTEPVKFIQISKRIYQDVSVFRRTQTEIEEKKDNATRAKKDEMRRKTL